MYEESASDAWYVTPYLFLALTTAVGHHDGRWKLSERAYSILSHVRPRNLSVLDSRVSQPSNPGEKEKMCGGGVPVLP